MKELIKKDNYGMFVNIKDMARVDSLYVAKQFKRKNNIDDSVRPYLADKQLEMLDRLQIIDLGLLVSTPDYDERKRLLELMNKEYR